jgi:hypothetical protein
MWQHEVSEATGRRETPRLRLLSAGGLLLAQEQLD